MTFEDVLAKSREAEMVQSIIDALQAGKRLEASEREYVIELLENNRPAAIGQNFTAVDLGETLKRLHALKATIPTFKEEQ